MPGRASDPGNSLVPFSPEVRDPVVYPIRHGIKTPLFRVFVSWSHGNLLNVACLQASPPESNAAAGTAESEAEIGGKVVEVRLGDGDGEINEAKRRRIAYGSVPAFAMLQSRRNSLSMMSRMASSSFRNEWWRHVLEYSNQIKDLLGNPRIPSSSIIEDPKMVLQQIEEPTSLKAAWELMEMFYVDKQSSAWLPERLVDWLADYDCILAKTEPAIYSKLLNLQKKIVNIQVIEDDPEYWDGISSALAVGWLDVVVKLLRLHGSYQLDQLGNRETENGLVEAVAVLVSTMPHMRADLPTGKLGQCYKTKPDFVKAWEKWRGHLTKLECSAFWVQCGHRQTREGLRNLLQIMLGNIKNLTTSTCHWMELYISHFLFIRPFSMGLEGMYSLSQKCMQLKPSSNSSGLIGVFIGILGGNTEVVLAECSKAFGPWMVAHAMELLMATDDHADILLHEERYNLGGISMEELYRLIYAQVLSSHPQTWQIAPTYLASCSKQGLGLLEVLLYRQSAHNYRVTLKNLEICRLYELENISECIMKIAGVYYWKHGRRGSGIHWLQQANDEVRLNRIAQQLFDCIGKSISDDSFKQWEGLIELLGSEVGTAGGLEFLHKYRDFKRSLHLVHDKKAVDAARQTVESLVQNKDFIKNLIHRQVIINNKLTRSVLMRSPSTPRRFWLPLLHDSVHLLNWQGQPLLNFSETTLLLSKLQELSMAKLHPDFSDFDLPPQALATVRLALATNLRHAILEES